MNERSPSGSDDLEAHQAASVGLAEDISVSSSRGVRTWLRKHWQIPFAIVMLGFAYLTLRGHLPSEHSIRSALHSANVGWIVVAALCEAISLGMFARQQRALLRAVGVRMSMPRAVGVTYARSALAISMPAGSAVSAGFAFQQYRRNGASNDKAAAVMVLSGVVSFLGLGVLYVVGVIGLVASGPAKALRQHPSLIYVVGSVLVCLVVAWFFRRRLSISGKTATDGVSARIESDGEATGWLSRIRVTIVQTIAAWRSLEPRDWLSSGGFAVANWLLDLLCLVASARAFELPVGLFTIATMYLGVQIIRQLPITPGGIGLIETGLLAGLTHAGAGAGAAAAVVLTYRLLSCWLIIPLGGVAWLGLRAGTHRATVTTADSTDADAVVS